MTNWPDNPDFEPHPAAAEVPPPLAVILIDPYAPTRSLTTASFPENAGTTSGDGVFPSGTTVTVSATPDVDKHFTKWVYGNGLTASMHRDYSFSITADTELTAHFADGAIIPPEPELQGPLNVFVERVHSAEALNRAYDTKATYLKLGFEQPPDIPPPPPAPPITPIGAGGPVTIDETKYMLDPAFRASKVIPNRR
jgi:hypothetical protein